MDFYKKAGGRVVVDSEAENSKYSFLIKTFQDDTRAQDPIKIIFSASYIFRKAAE